MLLAVIVVRSIPGRWRRVFRLLKIVSTVRYAESFIVTLWRQNVARFRKCCPLMDLWRETDCLLDNMYESTNEHYVDLEKLQLYNKKIMLFHNFLSSKTNCA